MAFTKLVGKLASIGDSSASEWDRLSKARGVFAKLKEKTEGVSGVSKLDAPSDLNRKLVQAVRGLIPAYTLWQQTDPNENSEQLAPSFINLLVQVVADLGVHQWNFEVDVDRSWNGYGTGKHSASLLWVLFANGAADVSVRIPEPACVVKFTQALLSGGADPTVHNFAIFRAAHRLGWFDSLATLVESPHCAASLTGVSPSPILHMMLHDALKEAASNADVKTVGMLIEGGVPPQRPSFCPPPPASAGLFSSVTPLLAVTGATKAQQEQPGDTDRGADGLLRSIAERRIGCLKLLIDAGADAYVVDSNGNNAARYSRTVAEKGLPSTDWGVWDDPAPLIPDMLPADLLAIELQILEVDEYSAYSEGSAVETAQSTDEMRAQVEENTQSDDGIPEDTEQHAQEGVATASQEGESLDGNESEEQTQEGGDPYRRDTGQNVIPSVAATAVFRVRPKKKNGRRGDEKKDSKTNAMSASTDRTSKEMKLPLGKMAIRVNSLLTRTVHNATISAEAPLVFKSFSAHGDVGGLDHRVCEVTNGLHLGDLLVKIVDAEDLGMKSEAQIKALIATAGPTYKIGFVRDNEWDWLSIAKVDSQEGPPLSFEFVTTDHEDGYHEHRVSSISENGPAMKAGLAAGDLLCRVDDAPTGSLSHDMLMDTLNGASEHFVVGYIRNEGPPPTVLAESVSMTTSHNSTPALTPFSSPSSTRISESPESASGSPNPTKKKWYKTFGRKKKSSVDLVTSPSSSIIPSPVTQSMSDPGIMSPESGGEVTTTLEFFNPRFAKKS